MKYLIFILIIFHQLQAFSTKFDLVEEGTLGAPPYPSENVEIISEHVTITPDSNFKTARFDITYRIMIYAEVSKPLMWNRLGKDPIVLLDGKQVQLQGVNSLDGNAWEYQEMVYFETDISKGEHTIHLSYTAQPWTDLHNWVKQYSFRYDFTSGDYRKYIQTLEFSLNSTTLKKTVSCNLGDPYEGRIDSIAHWKLRDFRAELKVYYRPEINNLAKTMLQIGPLGLALAPTFIVILLHIFWIVRYRKNNLDKEYSLAVLAGSFLVPLFFVIAWLKMYSIIDSVIGEHAASYRPFVFLMLFLYPLILPPYWLLMWYTDKRIKRKLKQPKSVSI